MAIVLAPLRRAQWRLVPRKTQQLPHQMGAAIQPFMQLGQRHLPRLVAAGTLHQLQLQLECRQR